MQPGLQPEPVPTGTGAEQSRFNGCDMAPALFFLKFLNCKVWLWAG